MNKITVIGRLGRDPEMRYTPNGQSVTSFSVASNHRYTAADGERREETEWFNVNAWGRLADLCNQYLTRGQQVYVEGRLRSRSFVGQDGQTRNSNDIFLQNVEFLGGRGAEGGGGAGPPYESGQGSAGGGSDFDPVDDLPF